MAALYVGETRCDVSLTHIGGDPRPPSASGNVTTDDPAFMRQAAEKPTARCGVRVVQFAPMIMGPICGMIPAELRERDREGGAGRARKFTSKSAV